MRKQKDKQRKIQDLKVMKKIIFHIVVLLLYLSLSLPSLYAANDKKDEITIVIPARIVAGFINEALPIEIEKKKAFSGIIWIQSIDNIKLGLNKGSFSVTMQGKDIRYTGKIGTLSTSVGFGNITISFDCEASIRYDKEKKILFVKPNIIEKGSRNELLGQLLAALTNDREFPVEIQKLKPIITKSSGKTVTINMNISNVYTVNNRLFIGIRPTFEKTNK